MAGLKMADLPVSYVNVLSDKQSDAAYKLSIVRDTPVRGDAHKSNVELMLIKIEKHLYSGMTISQAYELMHEKGEINSIHGRSYSATRFREFCARIRERKGIKKRPAICDQVKLMELDGKSDNQITKSLGITIKQLTSARYRNDTLNKYKG